MGRTRKNGGLSFSNLFKKSGNKNKIDTTEDIEYKRRVKDGWNDYISKLCELQQFNISNHALGEICRKINEKRQNNQNCDLACQTEINNFVRDNENKLKDAGFTEYIPEEGKDIV